MPTVAGHILLRAVADVPRRRDCSAAQNRLRAEALELLRAEAVLEPGYSYRFVSIDRADGGVLSVAGETLEAPWLLPESGTLTAVACCVATLHEGLETRVRALFAARRAALALILDDLGNELLFALTCLAQDRMLAAATRQGLSMAGELRSGDPGLALATQGTVLALAGAETLGVTLSSGCVMRPIKSTSMVLGVGLALPKVHWSRCDHCARRARCRVADRFGDCV
jgi:hypothetical protein